MSHVLALGLRERFKPFMDLAKLLYEARVKAG
jgi:hypothetical protein